MWTVAGAQKIQVLLFGTFWNFGGIFMIQLVELNDEEPIDMSTNCILTPLNYILRNGEDGQFCFPWFFFSPCTQTKKKKKGKNKNS